MTRSTLISSAALAGNLDDPALVVVDVRSSLADPEYGRTAYRAGHIPGAHYADLNSDLSDPPGGGRGRHPMPAVASMAATFSALGIAAGSTVVAYDDADGMYASRLWWMLRYLGHDAVRVLDGGFANWTAGGYPVTVEVRTPPPAVFVPHPRPEMLVTAEQVEAIRLSPDWRLVDSRAPDRFRGENETIDPIAGHIPGARNYFFKNNMQEDGLMRPPVGLESGFARVLDGIETDHVVFYCGSGVTACHNLLAMDRAGRHGAKLYAGSWSEWISDPDRPIATGDGGDDG